VLEQWAGNHNFAFSKAEELQPESDEQKGISLYSAMELGGVSHGVAGDDVGEVLEAAVSGIEFLDEANRKLLLTRLVERENLTSTGIGQGVAIPHPRSPLQDAIDQPAIRTCFLQNKVDFNSLDGKPVFVLFLLISTSIKTHLNLLSKLSFCLRDQSFVSFLASQPDQNMLLDSIAKFENIDN
jgi:PTS system nitrogen regulatory IIA component